MQFSVTVNQIEDNGAHLRLYEGADVDASMEIGHFVNSAGMQSEYPVTITTNSSLLTVAYFFGGPVSTLQRHRYPIPGVHAAIEGR